MSQTSGNAEILRTHFAALWSTMLEEWFSGEDSGYPTLSARYQSVLQSLQPAGVLMDIVILEAQSLYEKNIAEENLVEPIKQAVKHRFDVEQKITISVKNPEAERSPSVPSAPSPTALPTPTPSAPPASLEENNVSINTTDDTQEKFEPINKPRNEFNDKWNKFNQLNELPQQNHQYPRTNKQVATNATSGFNTRFNRDHTFESFVQGPSNSLALAACQAVAEAPGKAYNPLLIWGDSGLGKTHLLHAIGQHALELYPHLKVGYMPSEEMMNHFINAIENQKMEAFKNRYRSLDILIVDDIQFLQGKEQLQEEFFHMFNALQNNNKQIVLSSDRPPVELTTLEDRLRTRFSEGLTADVKFPSLETRIAIVNLKARAENIELPSDVARLIAERYQRSVRELGGALTRVLAYCSLSDVALDVEAAKYVLQDMQPTDPNYEITPQVIIETAANYFNLSPDEVIGKGRAKKVAHARQISMYLCRELTELSLVNIGVAFGGKDHTTVRHADKKIREQIAEDQKVFKQLNELTEQIKRNARN